MGYPLLNLNFAFSLILMLTCLLKVGELIGGSQREERFNILKQRCVILTKR
jgi:hypothetical protein